MFSKNNQGASQTLHDMTGYLLAAACQIELCEQITCNTIIKCGQSIFLATVKITGYLVVWRCTIKQNLTGSFIYNKLEFHKEALKAG